MTSDVAGALGDWELFHDLEEELQRLPLKLKTPLILCYLEEQSHERAAQQLQWPLGTLKSRLVQARELLRKRMMRRGHFLVSGAVVALLKQQGTAAGALPSVLVSATTKAALGYVTGTLSGASMEVAALAENMVHLMFLTKLKSAMLALVTFGLLVAAVGAAAAWRSPDDAAKEIQRHRQTNNNGNYRVADEKK